MKQNLAQTIYVIRDQEHYNFFSHLGSITRSNDKKKVVVFLLHFHEKMFTVFGASIAAFSIKTKQKSAICSALYWYFDGTLLILAVQIH